MALPKTDNTECIDRTWEIFMETKDADARERLIVHYAPMIKYIVGRLNIYIGSAIGSDDLVSFGIFGLIDAIDKFSLLKGAKFETYAHLRIRGAVLDGLRLLDWVPRDLRKKNKRLEEAYLELENDLGQEPSHEQLAEKLGITTAELDEEIRKSSLVSLISLDEYLDENHENVYFGTGASDKQTPEAALEQKELKNTLADAIEKLGDQERLVVTLHYYEELTLREISHVMNLSESRISQIHSKAMLKLRTRLGRHKSVLFS